MTPSDLVYASPKAFSLRQRILLRVVPPIVAGTLKIILFTCRVELRGEENFRPALDRGDHLLAGIWHETLALAVHFMKNDGFHTLTSYSFDGEMAAKFVGQFGIKALRGSSSRGGMRALSQLATATKSIRVVGLTLDGPRGPRRVSKPGLAMLAADTQLPIYLIASAATRSWRLKSWDRFLLPKPFSKIIYSIAGPIAPPVSKEREVVKAKVLEIQDALNALQSEIERVFSIDPQLDSAVPDAPKPSND